MEVFAIFIASILLLIGSKLLMKKRIKLQLPPGPKGLPLLGSLIAIRKRPHECVAKLAKIYGPLMTLKLGFVNVVAGDVHASTSEARFAALREASPGCRHCGVRLRPRLGMAPRRPAVAENPKDFQHPHLHAQKLDSLQDLRHQVMGKMTQRIIEAGEASMDIGGIVFGSVAQLLSYSVFSVDILDPTSDAMKQLQRLITNIMVLSGKPSVADYFPFLRPFDVQGIKREIRKSYDRLHHLIDDMIEQRMHHRNSEATSRRGDILDDLLDFTEVEGHDGLTLLDVKLLITDIYIAGTDTTTTTVEWAMAELIRNPAVQSKLKRELKQKIGLGKRVPEKDVLLLPYLTGVIKETMRLHPITPFLLPHQAQQQVEIQGFTIPKDTPIWINFWSISRDPAYWDNPTRFIPERFLTSDMNFRGSNFLFTPFSSGRRTCPGLNLATRMVSLLLATLLHEFEWKLPKGITPGAMDMTDTYGVTLKKTQSLSLIPLKVTV